MEATLTRTPRALTDGRELVKKADMRDHPRVSARSMVTVVWRDKNGQIRYMRSLVWNISGGGVLVMSYRSLPIGAFIRIRDRNLFFLAGCGRVRHCTRWGFVYLIGLKFDSQIAARF
jgi:hypothetical protein